MTTVAPAMAGASSVVIESATYEPRPGQSKRFSTRNVLPSE